MPGHSFIPLDELDQRYFGWAEALPPPLATLAVERRLFTGQGDSQRMTSLRDVHPLVTCLPWLFVDAFSEVSPSDLFDISEAGTLLMLGVLLRDHSLDGQIAPDPQVRRLQSQLDAAALRKLRTLFDAQSAFWAYFDDYQAQYTTALVRELEHHGRITPYPMDMLQQIGSGKVALLKTASAALALKAQRQSAIPCLDAALDAFTAALQLGDDIQDWAEDYAAQRYTLPLTCAIPVEHWPIPHLSAADVCQRLEASLIRETLLKQALDWFHQALVAIGDLHCPRWVEFVQDRLVLAQCYQRSLVAAKLSRIMSDHRHVRSH